MHGWPEGTFGLPMPKTGCPVGAVVDWETGKKKLHFFLTGSVSVMCVAVR